MSLRYKHPILLDPELISLRPSLSTRAHDHQPVSNVPVTLIMVDESVLSLNGYELSDPLPLFYPNDPTSITFLHTRAQCWLMNVEDAEALKKSMLEKQSQLMEAVRAESMMELETSSMAAPRSRMMMKKMKRGASPNAAGGSRLLSLTSSMSMAVPMAAPMMLAMAPPPGSSMGYGGASDLCGAEMSSAPIAVRSNFDPLAAVRLTYSHRPDGPGRPSSSIAR